MPGFAELAHLCLTEGCEAGSQLWVLVICPHLLLMWKGLSVVLGLQEAFPNPRN